MYESIKHGTDRHIEQHINELPRHFMFRKPKIKPTVVNKISMIAKELTRIGNYLAYCSYSLTDSLAPVIVLYYPLRLSVCSSAIATGSISPSISAGFIPLIISTAIEAPAEAN